MDQGWVRKRAVDSWVHPRRNTCHPAGDIITRLCHGLDRAGGNIDRILTNFAAKAIIGDRRSGVDHHGRWTEAVRSRATRWRTDSALLDHGRQAISIIGRARYTVEQRARRVRIGRDCHPQPAHCVVVVPDRVDRAAERSIDALDIALRRIGRRDARVGRGERGRIVAGAGHHQRWHALGVVGGLDHGLVGCARTAGRRSARFHGRNARDAAYRCIGVACLGRDRRIGARPRRRLGLGQQTSVGGVVGVGCLWQRRWRTGSGTSDGHPVGLVAGLCVDAHSSAKFRVGRILIDVCKAGTGLPDLADASDIATAIVFVFYVVSFVAGYAREQDGRSCAVVAVGVVCRPTV